MKAIIIAFIAAVLLGAIALRHNRNLKRKAKKCAKEAQLFHEELQRLSAFDRVFTDKEVRNLKIKYNPLLETVNSLYDSYFISNEYLDDLGLGDFMEERKLLNHTQFINNKAHKS